MREFIGEARYEDVWKKHLEPLVNDIKQQYAGNGREPDDVAPATPEHEINKVQTSDEERGGGD